MAACGALLTLLAGGYVVYAHDQRATLPAPTGPYAVGRTQFDWVDTARMDPLADVPATPRAVNVWLWYPAAVMPASRPAPYLPASWRTAAGHSESFVNRAANGLLGLVAVARAPRSHAYRDAPPAAAPAPFPVLIMQPGMGLAAPDYTALAEDLASHGYVVVGLNETDSSDLVTFADGHYALATAKGKIADDASDAEVARQEQAIAPVWRADATFALDELQRLNADATSPFHGTLRLDRVGFFGHSFGGATALALCQQDARCAAGADLDGTPVADTQGVAVPRPFLFMVEGYAHGCASDASCRPVWQAYQDASGPATFVTLDGAAHSNFSDVPARFTWLGRAALRRLGAVGAISPRRGLTLVSAYLVAFFDRYLRGSAAPLLAGPSPYPETQVTSKP